MKKHIEIIIAIGMLMVGLGIGYVTGISRGVMQQSHDSVTQSTDTHQDTSKKMSTMNTDLSSKSGDEFDKAFLSGMIEHHRSGVEMANLALIQGTHEEIRDLAQAIVEAQNKEITDMQGWLRSWYDIDSQSSDVSNAHEMPAGQ